jgi:hypothetical protein
MKKFILWLWQLPQNICGVVYRKIIKDDIIAQVNTDSGYNIYLTETNRGGVTLGEYIFVYQKYTNISGVIQHETGHVKQSRILGPLYLLVIGLPSIVHATLHRVLCRNNNYYHFYTEKWANKLAGLE